MSISGDKCVLLTKVQPDHSVNFKNLKGLIKSVIVTFFLSICYGEGRREINSQKA